MIFNFGKLTIDTEKEPYRSEGIRIAFYSAPGTRKSYTVAACIIEPFLAESRTVVIFQPKSEWHTLKQKYSLIVVGGHFQDIPLAINQAKVYADAIVKHGVSMAFDFTETEDRDLVRFAAELLARIFTLENVERRPILLFFEELAEYCPFSVKGKLVEPWIYERMSSRIVKIATQGRALGINIVATSQRPAQLNFTVRMMMNLSLYGKFHPKDLNDIKEVLSHYELPTSPKEMAQKCVSMPHGSWIGITSEKVVFTKITATRVTPHGADTPKVEYVAPMTQEAQKTMDELTKTITDALEKEKVEESELDKAKEKIGDLEKKLRETEEEMKNLKIALTVAGSQSGSKGVDIETYNKVTQELERLRQERANIIEKIHGRIEDVFKEISVPAETRPSVSTMREEDLEQKKNRIYETWKNKFPSRAAERIFKYLLDNYPGKFTLSQIGVSLGYKAATSGSFGSAISFLRNNHLIVKDDKLYSASLG